MSARPGEGTHHTIFGSPIPTFLRCLHPFLRAVLKLQEFSLQAPFYTTTFGIPTWGSLASPSPFPAASPKPTHPFLDQLATGQFWPLPLPVTGHTGDIIGLCYVPRSVLLLTLLFFVPGVVMAVAYGLISRELYLGLRFDGDDGEIQSRVRNQGALPGGAAPGG